jgi:hypothetical protein
VGGPTEWSTALFEMGEWSAADEDGWRERKWRRSKW